MYKNWIKDVLDFSIAFFACLLTLPIMLLVAMFLTIEFGRSILFIQERPGKSGKIFKIYKFRTMNNKCDSMGKLLPDVQRLTPTGRFLRSTSLDELPQLVNVLKGDMSLVGPRPLLVSYLSKYSPEQMRRHEVKPGITGWAQINGRNAILWEEKFKLDVWYVDHLSFRLDAKIVFLTLKKVIFREYINADSNYTMKRF